MMLQELACIADAHSTVLQLDILRAYHFGRKYLVEMEIVLPKVR
jgi:hypothetical protein